MKNYDIVQLRREYLEAIREMHHAERQFDRPYFHAKAKLADAAWETLEEAIRKDACPFGTGYHQPHNPDSLGNVYCHLCGKILSHDTGR